MNLMFWDKNPARERVRTQVIFTAENGLKRSSLDSLWQVLPDLNEVIQIPVIAASPSHTLPNNNNRQQTITTTTLNNNNCPSHVINPDKKTASSVMEN